MRTNEDPLTLQNLGGGAVVEKFQNELDRVVRNIRDINAKAGKRSITLKVDFVPSKSDCSFVRVDVDCKSTLQPPEAFTTNALVGIGADGKTVANELIPQAQLDFGGDVIPITKKG